MQASQTIELAFNGVALLNPLTGIGNYTAQLAQRMYKDPGLNTRFFYGTHWSNQVRTQAAPAVHKLLPWIRKNIPRSYDIRQWLQIRRFRAGTQNGAIDLYHEPNNVPLPFDGPLVLTVHDLSWIRYPQTHPAERVKAMDRYFESGLRRATQVITDSQFVKQELIDVFGLDPAFIHPIALGADARFLPQTSEQTQITLSRHQLQHGRYLLVVGTLEPRKNLQRALQAFMAMPRPLRQRHPLVLVGMTGWQTNPLQAQLTPLLAAGEVRQLGYLAPNELSHIMAAACALVYPSIYEGFGLPPLEAMACGVPVIASNVSSIPEVVGDTGILLDPQDTLGLTEAMTTLVSAPDIRANLSARALQRSQIFSWDECADLTQRVYQKAMGRA
jgi:glycosyltransferase involved in cell wall biosynthesis